MSQQIEDPTRENLKASLWFSIGKLIDEECARLNTTATPQFIGAMTEMVWAQLETVATDLESFSRHAGRSTITTDDVLLMTRRNDALQGIIKDFIDTEKAAKSDAGGSGRKDGKAVAGRGRR